MARLSKRNELFSAYLDGELEEAEIAVVSDLLTTNEQAIADFRKIREIRAVLRLLPELRVPLDLLPGGHFSEQLSAYLDGELSPSEMRVVAGHLLQCEDCRANLHELDRARIAVRSLPGIDPPEFLEFSRRMEDARRKIRLNRWAVLTASVAAAVMLLVGLSQLPEPANPTITLDELSSHHVVRASVQPGFPIFPIVSDGSLP